MDTSNNKSDKTRKKKATLTDKYAVVAMGGIFPDAPTIDDFWNNIINKKSSIRALPEEFFDSKPHFFPEVKGKINKENKTYTNLSAIIPEVDFNPLKFKIPPAMARHMDDNQKVAVLAAEQALQSGILDDVDKARVSVFMGNTLVGQHHHDYFKRMSFNSFEHYLNENRDFINGLPEDVRSRIVQEVKDLALKGILDVTEDSAPGVLPNITAARINSIFDLHGHAYILDAACASSLASIITGIQQLKLNESDAVICGGADMQAKELGLVYFSGINALSATGSFPFDDRADGFVIGMGGGVVVLKRLADAMLAGDEILAVVTGYGQLSDGKGKAIAAPNSDWQAESIRRAYEMAGYSTDTVELIEAHGTATQVGDKSEFDALSKCFDSSGESTPFCGLTSVKSNIGHLKSAAGIAGFIKAVKAVQTKTLPPVSDYKTPNRNIDFEKSPFYVVDKAAHWPAKPHPRRAGVSAFGFGGADYHIAIEEFRAEDYDDYSRADLEKAAAEVSFGQSRVHLKSEKSLGIEAPDTAASFSSPQLIAQQNLTGLVLVSGQNREALLKGLKELHQQINENSDEFYQTLFDHNTAVLAFQGQEKQRLSFTVSSPADFSDKLTLIEQQIQSKKDLGQLSLKGIFYSSQKPVSLKQTAYLFPGQGSQYPDMTSDLLKAFDSGRNTMARIDALWRSLAGNSVSELIQSADSGPDAQKLCSERLKKTCNTHPAMVGTSLAVFEILKSMDLIPSVMVGHSLGELTALTAAGKIALPDALRLAQQRAAAFESVPEGTGSMAAFRGSLDQARELIEGCDDVYLANVNSPAQIILSGTKEGIHRITEKAEAGGRALIPVPVSHAFHSPLMQSAQEQFSEILDNASTVKRIQKTSIDVIACETGEKYKTSARAVAKQLSTQICASVDFVSAIQNLYDQGTRLFVEVGPGSVLTGLVRSILKEKTDVAILSSDNKKGSSVEAFQKLLGQLFTAGLPFHLSPINLSTINSSHNNLSALSSTSSPRPDLRADSVKTGILDTPNLSRPVVYSGVSAGLPGAGKNAFQDDNFEQLFKGQNQIEILDDKQKQSLVDLRISKLIKSEKGAAFTVLESLNQVIQLMGKVGQVDLLRDYSVDPKEIRNMSSALALAVAAGYEALRDAQIPLVHEYSSTKSGAVLPERWALPQEMQKETGIIFANGFPLIEPVLAEASRYFSFTLKNSVKQEISEIYEDLLMQVTDVSSREAMMNWYQDHIDGMSNQPGEDELYTFNHHLMNQIASQANNRLASYIGAQGPNFSINAACSSTSTAVTLAEEMIKSGRVKRMIIIGSDDVGTEASLPLIGAGFLSTGACSNESDLYKAAVPFDRRRNGMIMGAGAVGIIVETAESCAERGVIPLCELMGTHVFNTAGHQSSLDVPKYAEELELFMERMESSHGIDRSAVADELIYMSHETYTPAVGGCSESEAVSLKHVFGENFRNIEISNTKGMTGHTMGASIEEAAAAKGLQFGKIPPVVNHKEADPSLEGLKLSKGGRHRCRYALRMAAGFGAQGNFILLKKVASGANRIADKQVFQSWLAKVSNNPKAETVIDGRRLLVKDAKPGSVIQKRPNISVYSSVNQRSSESAVSAVSVKPNQDITRQVLKVISEVTGYDTDLLTPEMEIEADLGVDTVKQATILSMLGDRFGHKEEQGFRIADFPTIGHIISLFSGAGDDFVSIESMPTVALAESGASIDSSVGDAVLKVISEVTGYDTDLLTPEMEIEADLGVDTVKQATILSLLGEQFGHKEEQGFRIADFPTIGHIIRLFSGAGDNLVLTESSLTGSSAESAALIDSHVGDTVLKVISEVTGYDTDLLTPEMEIEADLGVDTVKQATILSLLGEQFGHKEEQGFRIADFPTIGHIIRLFAGSSPLSKDSPVSVPISGSSELLSRANSADSVNRQSAGAVAVDIPKSRISPAWESLEHLVFSAIESCSDYKRELIPPDFTIQKDLGLTDAQVSDIDRFIKKELLEGKQDTTSRVNERRKDLLDKWSVQKSRTPLEIIQELEQNHCQSWLYPVDFDQETGLSRQILIMEEVPLQKGKANRKGAAASALTDSAILVIGEHQTTLDRMIGVLTDVQAKPVSFRLPSQNSIQGCISDLHHILDNHTFDYVVDLTNIGAEVCFATADSHALYEAVHRAADLRFAIYKTLSAKGIKPSRLIAALSMDGEFGISGDSQVSINPVCGLYSGFYKGLRKEWARFDSQVKVIDLGPFSGITDDALVLICEELAGPFEHAEVGYKESKRFVLVARDQAFDSSCDAEENLALSGFDTIVITGGGSGITFQVAEELASRFPLKIALIGRTSIVENIDTYKRMDDQQLAAEKRVIQQRLQSEGVRVTPVLINKEFSKIQKSLEITRNLERLRALGCSAEYFACDVTDLDQLSAVFTRVKQKFGPVSGVLHGAGVEISQFIDKKTPEEFHLVHSIKSIGAVNLSLLCRNEPLRFVIGFSSISGRFGNMAQLDYSAGNDFLNCWARMYNRRDGVHSRALCWSAWADTGMGIRNSYVRKNAELMGMQFIAPEQGRRAALQEICRSTRNTDVVLHKGLGHIQEKAVSAYSLAELPFIDRITEHNGSVTEVYRHFSIERDALLNQHRYNRVPLMPGVGFMEMMAEASTLLTSKRGAFVFRDLVFSDAFKLYREEPREVRITVTPQKKECSWLMDVSSPMKTAQSALSQWRPYSQALFSVEEKSLSGMDPAEWDLGELTQSNYDELNAQVADFKNNVDLGPILDDCKRTKRPEDSTLYWGPKGYKRKLRFPVAQFSEDHYPEQEFFLNPAFLDTVHQAGAVFSILRTGSVYLPFGAGEFVVLKEMKKDEIYDVTVQFLRDENDRAFYNIVLQNQSGDVTAFVRESIFHKVNQ